MPNFSLKPILLFLILLQIVFSCKENKQNNFYSKGYIQKSTFDSTDINDILKSNTFRFSEDELQKVVNFKELRLTHKIRIDKLDYSIFEWDNSSKTIRVFTTEDTIKLMVVDNEGIDQTAVYIQRNPKYKLTINHLVNGKDFKQRTLLTEDVPEFRE